DLNDDHAFGDEKPVTSRSPRAWRDVDGDGFVDLSGGMLYYVSDGTGPSGRPVPGGLEAFGVEITGDPGELLAWTATSTRRSAATGRTVPATSSGRAWPTGSCRASTTSRATAGIPAPWSAGRPTPPWAPSGASPSASNSPTSSP